MADLYPEIETAMEPVQELGRRNRRLRTMRDDLWSRWPWRWVPTWPPVLRRRVFGFYAVRHFDAR